MSSLLRVCLYNTDPDSSKELESHIRSLNFVRLVEEVGHPDDLGTILEDGSVNLIFFHLDPKPEPVLEVIDQVSTRYPAIALIAISHQSDPQAILAPMRAGCDQFVCEPIEHADFSSAVSRVASRRLSSSTKSRCVCVVAPSGGSGATSIACNLALEIGHLSDRECALVDMNLQFGDVAMLFDVDPKYSMFDLADASGHLDRAILSSTITSLPCKVALLARPENIEQEEAVTPEVVHGVIELLAAAYENVVIDLPGSIDPRTSAALAQADLIIVICQLLVPSVRNAKRYGAALVAMGIPEERVQYVINRSEGKSSRLSASDLEEAVKKKVFGCVPNDYQFVAKSIDLGRPIAALDHNNPVRAAIRKLAKRIVSKRAGEVAEPEDRRGFLSRLLTTK